MSEKLTKAQMDALRKVQRRNWPAGEPSIDWLNRPTAAVLFRRGLISVRDPGHAMSIVDLTDAGRSALGAD